MFIPAPLGVADRGEAIGIDVESERALPSSAYPWANGVWAVLPRGALARVGHVDQDSGQEAVTRRRPPDCIVAWRSCGAEVTPRCDAGLASGQWTIPTRSTQVNGL